MVENMAGPHQLEKVEGEDENAYSDSQTVTTREPNKNPNRQKGETSKQQRSWEDTLRPQYEEGSPPPVLGQNGRVNAKLEEMLAELGRMK